jgi:hypothetical protein
MHCICCWYCLHFQHQPCHSQCVLGNEWKTNLSHFGVIHIDLSMLLDKHKLQNSLLRFCGHRNAKNIHTIFLYSQCQSVQVVCLLLFLHKGFSKTTKKKGSVFVVYACEYSSVYLSQVPISEVHGFVLLWIISDLGGIRDTKVTKILKYGLVISTLHNALIEWWNQTVWKICVWRINIWGNEKKHTTI